MNMYRYHTRSSNNDSAAAATKMTTAPISSEKEQLSSIINLSKHPLTDPTYITHLQQTLDTNGVITLPSFLLPSAHTSLLKEANQHAHQAYFTKSTHSVYQTTPEQHNPNYPHTHPCNQQVTTTKGCITTDQIPNDSLLKILYNNEQFQTFCSQVLLLTNNNSHVLEGMNTCSTNTSTTRSTNSTSTKLYPYQDPLSQINVHYYKQGQELGWHFDTSSFAITLLLQKPNGGDDSGDGDDNGGGNFEYIPNARQSSIGEQGYDLVHQVLHTSAATTTTTTTTTTKSDHPARPEIKTLTMEPCTLVIFRGRDCLHRVTPVVGNVMRILVVFAYNDEPGVSMPEEARMTFYGRTGLEEELTTHNNNTKEKKKEIKYKQ